MKLSKNHHEIQTLSRPLAVNKEKLENLSGQLSPLRQFLGYDGHLDWAQGLSQARSNGGLMVYGVAKK